MSSVASNVSTDCISTSRRRRRRNVLSDWGLRAASPVDEPHQTPLHHFEFEDKQLPGNKRDLSSVATTCNPAANVTAIIILSSPSSAEINSTIAQLYGLLGNNSLSSPSSGMRSCPVPAPHGKGWINARTSLEVSSSVAAPDGITQVIVGDGILMECLSFTLCVLCP